MTNRQTNPRLKPSNNNPCPRPYEKTSPVYPVPFFAAAFQIVLKNNLPADLQRKNFPRPMRIERNGRHSFLWNPAIDGGASRHPIKLGRSQKRPIPTTDAARASHQSMKPGRIPNQRHSGRPRRQASSPWEREPTPCPPTEPSDKPSLQNPEKTAGRSTRKQRSFS